MQSGKPQSSINKAAINIIYALMYDSKSTSIATI